MKSDGGNLEHFEYAAPAGLNSVAQGAEPVNLLRHPACRGGSTAFALLDFTWNVSSAKAVKPPGQARWRFLHSRAAQQFIRPTRRTVSHVTIVGLALWLALCGSLAVAQDIPSGESRVAPTVVESPDASQIRAELDDILSDPEFRRVYFKPEKQPETKWPQWLTNFFESLGDLLRPFFNLLGGLGMGIQAFAWTMLAVICGSIVYLVVRVISNYQKSDAARMAAGHKFDQGELPAAPGELAADVYLQRALALAAQGLYREAIGLLLLGLMSHTERSGLIRHRRGLTHRDYLRAVRGQVSLHQAFCDLVSTYEPICFGRRDALPDQFDSSLIGYHSGLKHD